MQTVRGAKPCAMNCAGAFWLVRAALSKTQTFQNLGGHRQPADLAKTRERAAVERIERRAPAAPQGATNLCTTMTCDRATFATTPNTKLYFPTVAGQRPSPATRWSSRTTTTMSDERWSSGPEVRAALIASGQLIEHPEFNREITPFHNVAEVATYTTSIPLSDRSTRHHEI
jgi:hypothetical protein